MTRVLLSHIGKTYASTGKPRQRFWDLVWGRPSTGEQFVALHDVSLTVPAGHTLGLVGRNGSGKSTLLQILCGTLTPTTGTVKVQGRIAALLELGSGFNPEFTGRDNVFLNGSLLGLRRQEVAAAFDSICAFAEIGAYIDQPVKTYSSGMFVRLAFAVVIHTKPDLLVVDEALAVGDARFQAKCLKAIQALKLSGVSIVLVTHDVGMVRQVCDSAVWLKDGTIAMNGAVNDVTSAYTQYLFEGETDALLLPATGAEATPVETDGGWEPNQRPLSRWGAMPNAITGCRVLDAGGSPIHVWHGLCQVTIQVRFCLAHGAALDTLSVAVAIKDVRGQDLLVLSTWDSGRRFKMLAAGQEETVSFTFSNLLNTGKYTLVAALEDRRDQTPHYYDFIEGAQFFEVLHDAPLMGLVVVDPKVRGQGLR